MGVIDKCTYTMTCPKCGVVESASVLDKGDRYSGSWWGPAPKFKHFKTEWTDGLGGEPELVSATCQQCNVAPAVDSYHST